MEERFGTEQPCQISGANRGPKARPNEGGESFWTVVHDPFMDRDITRNDLRTLVALGIELTRGDQAGLLGLFNVEPSDARRFNNFLRKHDCLATVSGVRLASSGASRDAGTKSERACGE